MIVDDRRRIEMCQEHDGQLVGYHCVGCDRPLCALCHRYEIAMRPWCPACAAPHLPDAVTEGAFTAVRGLSIGVGVAVVFASSLISPLAVIIALGVVGLSVGALFMRSRQGVDIRELKDGHVIRQLR